MVTIHEVTKGHAERLGLEAVKYVQSGNDIAAYYFAQQAAHKALYYLDALENRDV